jgi:acyl-CoA synthetase (NDP forming)
VPIAATGTPVFDAIEDAAAALAAVTGDVAPRGLAALPPAARPARDLSYFGVRRLLADAGLVFPAAVEVTDEPGVRFAASVLHSGPFVLKAVSLLHKSDAGGVVVGLPDEAALVEAWRAMHARLSAQAYSVEAMADLSEGVELIAGVRVDPRFGPVAMVGLGGVFTEALRDVAFGLAPLTETDAERLLLSLRTRAAFEGARGRRAVDLGSAAAAISRLTAVAAAHPEISELEVNPLLITPSGALALDARALPTAREE